MNIVTRVVTEKEYRALPKLSSSDFRLYLKDRKKFYKKYVLGEQIYNDDYEQGTLIGSIVHTLLLEGEEEFDNKFYLSNILKPPTGKMLEFTELLFKHTVESINEDGIVTKDFGELANLAYEESSYDRKLWKIDRVLLEFNKEAEKYYQELRESKTRNLTVVCTADRSIAEKVLQMIRNHPFIGPLFSQENSFNELKIEDIDYLGEKLKGMLDKVLRDDEAKTLQIVDLKVLFNNQEFRRDYYLKRHGWIPVALYTEGLIQMVMSGALGEDVMDYTILPPLFVVADSSCFYDPIIYEISNDQLIESYMGFEEHGRVYKGLKQVVEDVKWHQETGIWGMDRLVYENKGYKKV